MLRDERCREQPDDEREKPESYLLDHVLRLRRARRHAGPFRLHATGSRSTVSRQRGTQRGTTGRDAWRGSPDAVPCAEPWPGSVPRTRSSTL
jgi:hypothetical protein